MNRTYTHPSVLAGIAAGASWADPVMDPTEINWDERRRRALIPFPLVDGRPVNPYAPTGIRYGRNELGHWGEQACADALVTATTGHGCRWLLMVERDDGHGWAVPGGHVDPDDATPIDAAFRELREETGLNLNPASVRHTAMPARYVPDPRASDEAWMVTTPVRIDLGPVATLPEVSGGDDARRAAWVPAADYADLTVRLMALYGGVTGGHVFPAHVDLLRAVLG